MNSLVEIINLDKKFPTDFWAKPFVALDKLNFSIPKGKIIGFLGANGAGKTTSIKIIMGFIKPTAGQVIYSEILGKDFQEIRQNIGFVPERPYFYPHLTGMEFLKYMGRLNALSDHKINEQIDKWAQRLKIHFALDRKIHSYSKGMLQRLGFVSSLLHNPQLVILDEPVSGMDPVGRKEIKDVIKEINADGKTIFFSSHIVPDVEEICDEVIFLDKGKLVYQGSIDKLIHDNTSTSYYIKFKSPNSDGIESCLVEAIEKDKFIADKIKQGSSIVGVNQNKISLEEIFYQVKNEDRVIKNG